MKVGAAKKNIHMFAPIITFVLPRHLPALRVDVQTAKIILVQTPCDLEGPRDIVTGNRHTFYDYMYLSPKSWHLHIYTNALRNVRTCKDDQWSKDASW